MTIADKPPLSSAATEEEEVIPVIEERVRIDKTVKQGRTVTVGTRQVTEMVTLTQPLVRENVTVERIPVDEVVDEVPPVREDQDLTVIPVVEEQVRMVVELVLTEEIHVRRTRETIDEEFEISLRRTEVDIDD